MNKVVFLSICAISVFTLSACQTGPSEPCPPKSDTQVIADTISDILVPKIRIGCQ
jgi:hypothetical protein